MGTNAGLVEYSEEESGDVFIIRLNGRFDVVTAPWIAKHLNETIAGDHKQILLNFKGINHISSAGIQVLLVTNQKLKSLSGKLVLCDLNQTIMEILDVTGSFNVLTAAEDEEAALGLF